MPGDTEKGKGKERKVLKRVREVVGHGTDFDKRKIAHWTLSGSASGKESQA